MTKVLGDVLCFFPGSPKTQIKTIPYKECLAERTGLEPATPGVTGRYSNQLNYRSDGLVGVAGIEPATSGL